MKKILDNISKYVTKWWQGVDKQMLFWQVLAAILVIWSIYSNT
jgi:hypothetical protein